ncbi:MAG: hypothetical protein H7Y22_00390 [Gemmatimonadaceae bacterium]|nr:hypothetical protein [Gloeobacterales cyanobacterium ES-bin-141]
MIPAGIPTFAALFGASEFPLASYPQTGGAFAAARKLFVRDVLGPGGLALLEPDGVAMAEQGHPVPQEAVRAGCEFCDWFDSALSGNDQLQEFDDRIDGWQKRLTDRPGTRRLVVYYVGHGGTASSRYYLAVKASRQVNYLRQSITFEQLAESIKRLKPPYQCFLVIDACYAARGVVSLLQGADSLLQQGVEKIAQEAEELTKELQEEVNNEFHGRGVCLFCSSPATKPSYLLPDLSATSFMAALSKAVQKGKVNGRSLLSVQDLIDVMWDELLEVRRAVDDHNQQQSDPRQHQEFDAVRPQCHWPKQEQGINLTTEGLIPNRWKPSPELLPVPPLSPTSAGSPVLFPAVITARQFARFVLVNSPYLNYQDADTAEERGAVRVYLWLPEPATFLAPEKDIRDTPIVAICDTGLSEIDRYAALLRVNEKFLRDCFRYTPSRLVDGKKRMLVGLLARVLQGTFVLSAVVPKYLLSAGLKDPQASYDAILNVVLFSLVSAHAALDFTDFAVTVSEVKACRQGVLESALRVIRSGFPSGTVRIEDEQSQQDRFYLYAARLINWAESRKYHSNDGYWADLLASEFAKQMTQNEMT